MFTRLTVGGFLGKNSKFPPVDPAVRNRYLTSLRVGGGKAGRETRWAQFLHKKSVIFKISLSHDLKNNT